jgi:hypothetical protein
MVGTILLSLAPLYLTSRKDAVYDGALLALAFAFSSDAAFRCFDPEAQGGDLKVVLGIGAVLILVASALQYGPIANDMRKEKIAIRRSLQDQSIKPLASFEEERDADEADLPNDSIVLLISSVIAEFSVIIFIEG